MFLEQGGIGNSGSPLWVTDIVALPECVEIREFRDMLGDGRTLGRRMRGMEALACLACQCSPKETQLRVKGHQR